MLLLGDGDAPARRLGGTGQGARTAGGRAPIEAGGPPSGGSVRQVGLDAGRAAEALVAAAANHRPARGVAAGEGPLSPWLRAALQRLLPHPGEGRAGRRAATRRPRSTAAGENALARPGPGAAWRDLGPVDRMDRKRGHARWEVPLEPTLTPRAQCRRRALPPVPASPGPVARWRASGLVTLDSGDRREPAVCWPRPRRAPKPRGRRRSPPVPRGLPESGSASCPPPLPRVPRRRRTSPLGRAGRGEDNAALTFQVARPHHLWMHARGVPGCARGGAAGPGRGRGPVDAAPRRAPRVYFSRAAGANPGARWPGPARGW